MQVDTDLIKQLEALSKIELSEEERKASAKDFEVILSYMDTLSRLDTENVGPSVIDTQNVFREDIVTNSDISEIILKNAAEAESGFFVIPKAVE